MCGNAYYLDHDNGGNAYTEDSVNETFTYHTLAKAYALEGQLNAEREGDDDFSYRVEERGKYGVIKVFDADGFHLGYL